MTVTHTQESTTSLQKAIFSIPLKALTGVHVTLQIKSVHASLVVYMTNKILFTQPLRPSRIWHKVNF